MTGWEDARGRRGSEPMALKPSMKRTIMKADLSRSGPVLGDPKPVGIASINVVRGFSSPYHLIHAFLFQQTMGLDDFPSSAIGKVFIFILLNGADQRWKRRYSKKRMKIRGDSMIRVAFSPWKHALKHLNISFITRCNIVRLHKWVTVLRFQHGISEHKMGLTSIHANAMRTLRTC